MGSHTQDYHTVRSKQTGDELYDSYRRTYGDDNPFHTNPNDRQRSRPTHLDEEQDDIANIVIPPNPSHFTCPPGHTDTFIFDLVLK